MARLLTIMVPEPGHIIPMIELARVLERLGHTTCFATFEHFHIDIQAAGFDCASIRAPRPLRSSGTNLLYSPLSVLDEKDPSGEANAKLEHQHLLNVLEVVRKFKPDLILIDRIFVHICRFLEGLHLRYLLVGSNFGDTLPSLRTHKLKHETELLLCPRELASDDDLRITNRYYFDVPITQTRSAPDFIWEAIDTSKPLAYCTFGTQVDTYPDATAVLRDVLLHLSDNCGFQVVAVMGLNFQHFAEALASPNILLTHCAPQLDLLKRATLLVTHGGLGTIKEALHFAVPMFLIPFAYDQFANADRVEAAGYGLQLSSRCWSRDCFQSRFEVFRSSLLQLRENILNLQDALPAAKGKLPWTALGELIDSILRSPS